MGFLGFGIFDVGILGFYDILILDFRILGPLFCFGVWGLNDFGILGVLGVLGYLGVLGLNDLWDASARARH